MINGMQETMTKCMQEIDHSQMVYNEKTKKVSTALAEQKSNIQMLVDTFLD